MEPAAPLAYAVERIGDRWTILIVDALMSGPRKFGELEADVTGIAPTVLTKRLRQLDTDGIVVGRPYSERPLRFSYELTGPGRALAGAIQLLRDWGASHTGDEDAATRRRALRSQRPRSAPTRTPRAARAPCRPRRSPGPSNGPG